MNQTAFLKRRRSKWADTMTLWEPVPTEEEAAGYHEQLAFEEEEEQILPGCFFPWRKTSEIGMFSVL